MKSIHIAIASTMSKPGAVADNMRQIAKSEEKNNVVICTGFAEANGKKIHMLNCDLRRQRN